MGAVHARGGSLGGRLTSLGVRVTDQHWLVLPPALDPHLLWPCTGEQQQEQLQQLQQQQQQQQQRDGSGEVSGGGGARSGSGARAALPPPLNQQLQRLQHQHQRVARPVDWGVPLTALWADGRCSNFEYLMALNHAVGRTIGDARLHAVLPWVSDLTDDGGAWGSWRDLGRTKLRLSRGDEFLDMTYRNSEPPHHVDECLSELTYYM